MANPFDIDALNNVQFDNDQIAHLSVFAPTYDTPEVQSSRAEMMFGGAGPLDPGTITVVNSDYTAAFTENVLAYDGATHNVDAYHLATFGAVQFSNLLDGSGNPLTLWIHGFTDNGLFLTADQDAYWIDVYYPSWSANGDTKAYAFGVYGIGNVAGYSSIPPGGVNAAGAIFSTDASQFTVFCFAEGARIETVDGPVAVEALSVGDLAVTASGERRPVKWIGELNAWPGRHPRPAEVNPVRVLAHAFGPNTPLRDVRLSPGHAVFVDGVLVPVGKLVNGATIVQETVEQVRYFHIELDSHDVVLAEGLPCESYLDDGSRESFNTPDGVARLHGRLDPKSWDGACAPMVADGPQLAEIRRRLHRQSEALGWVKCEDADLRLIAGGAEIAPLQVDGARYLFRAPLNGGLTLRSNAAVLAHTMPALNDARRLGVAVAELRIDGAPVDLDSEVFGAGFYPTERHPAAAWRWTDGEARLACADAAEATIEVVLAMVAPTWRRPAPDLRVAA